jgi:ribosomal peptide maturation radical SAM protein 1
LFALVLVLDALLRPAPIVLVVPPFHWSSRPAIGVHLLQAIARAAGVEVQILYANLAFAGLVGYRTYQTLATVQYGTFLGERLFARAAYGLPALGRDAGMQLAPRLESIERLYHSTERHAPHGLTLESLDRVEQAVIPWVESVALALAGGPAVVGCTSSFEQNAASIAILGALKRHAPDTTTILGGANCEGPMAEGIAAMTDAVDHVFSGESEATFRELALLVRDGKRPGARILVGAPCEALDELPVPDYTDYYLQLEAWMPEALAEAQLPFETSRGCWWGEKKHCTFCGLNGQGMASREKSADRALGELAALLRRHPTRIVAVTDNIMPHSYWKTLVPRLADELPGLHVMYEQKANLTLDQVCALARAGILEIQPGIESLSTGLLKLMDKGTTAAQNLALLRFTEALGIAVHWNLLCGFPGDQRSFYDETLELLPLIHHLPPPKLVAPIVLDRFSPYHSYPERYGIRELRPFDGYREVLPAHADAARVAYHFEGTFASASLEDPALIPAIDREVVAWRNAYHRNRPRLEVAGTLDGELALIDTRGLSGTTERRALTRAEAIAALVPRRTRSALDDATAWAIDARTVVIRDGRYVPLALAAPALLREAMRAAATADQLRVA